MSIEQLQEENRALAAQIKALKEQLGLDVIEREQEIKRVRALFELFDVDGSGTIEANEFQALAAQTGIYLTPDAVAKQLGAMNAGARLSFDDFYAWVESRETGELSYDMDDQQVAALKLQLQSGALVRSAAALKRNVSSRFAAAAANSQLALGDLFQIKISTDTVDFVDAATSIGVEYYNDAARASAFAEASECVGAPLVVAVDLNVRAGVSDEALGEIAGCVEPLIGMLPLPFPIEPVFSMHDGDGGQRFLRIALKTEFDPLAMASMMLPGVDATAFLKTLAFKIETSADVLRLAKVDAELMQDLPALAAAMSSQLKYRVALELAVEQSLVDLLAQIIPDMPSMARVGVLGTKMFKEFELNLKTFDVGQLITGEGPLQDLVPVLLTVPMALTSYAQNIAQVTPDTLTELLDNLGAPEPFQPLFKAIATNLIGVRGVQIQNQNVGLRLSIKGLDLLSLMPFQ